MCELFRVVKSLPKHYVHHFIDRVWLGKAYPKVHRKMDRPFLFFGKQHRELFHDFPTAYFIAREEYPEDPRAIQSAYLHIYYDELCTWDPEYGKYLEKLAKLDRQKRKASKKKRKKRKPKKKKEDAWESFLRFMEFYARVKSRRSHD